MPLESYTIIDGLGLDQWRSGAELAAPGGGRICGWEQEAEGLIRVSWQGEKPNFSPRRRWRRAQSSEAAFWRGWRRNLLYKHVSLRDFWRDVLDKSGGKLPTGRVVDVGCGPVSVLNFFRPQGLFPLGVDPLARAYAEEKLIESRPEWQPMPIVALPAERLPFGSNSIDHLVCFNVLDHVADVHRVLAELRRVLKPCGTLRVYVHSFAPWIKRFLFFDWPHTYHWDHAEFRALLRRAGFAVLLEREEPKTFDIPPGLKGCLTYLPYRVAAKVAGTSYFQLRKPGCPRAEASIPTAKT